MLFADVVATSTAVAATRSRKAKTELLAGLFREAPHDEIEAVVGFLVGEPRQGRVGVGWASLAGVRSTSTESADVTVGDVDALFSSVEAMTGSGSTAGRQALITDLLDRATIEETEFIRRLFAGELRQGALAGLVTEGVAQAGGVTARLLRRAVMLSGRLGPSAVTAMTHGAEGLEAIGLEVLRPVQPMLAATAPDVATALDATGEASVEWKLDGARIQVHRAGSRVLVVTRNLNDITARLPTVVADIAALSVDRIILDGEAIGWGADRAGPQPFQDTISSFAREDDPDAGAALGGMFFDCLHVDGLDLIDAPLGERLDALDAIGEDLRIPAIRTAEPAAAQEMLDRALAGGHEGVMVKALDSSYEAGRRGQAWRKVKPVHTLDLVVLAAEWGHGRRKGWLSNLHLGARDPTTGEFVMVGKTFKGLTDETLVWQTERFLDLEERREGITVWLRAAQVVEIALDGAQASTRYPGGVALRFARVKRYRDDKEPSGADTVDAVRALLPRGRPGRD